MGAETAHHSEGLNRELVDVSTLTAAAASELSSPLVLVRQLGFALSRDHLSDDERMKLSERLTLTSDRALRLTASLAMSIPGQSQFELEPVNPVSICQEVIHQLNPLFSAYGQKVTLKSRTRVPLSVANLQLLKQILLGFGDNAVHYGSPAHPVEFMINSRRDSVRIGVRDHGPAVPIDMWQRLEGKIARRARAPIANRPQASGVNLLAAKRLAEIMGSVVGVTRHQDGATFYVDLRPSSQMSLL